jgi:predicted nucleotidyltransferase
MDNETKQILKILIENKEKAFSIRKLSILRKINYKSAYNAIKKLNEQNLITIENLGNTTNCSFNYNFNPLVFEVEYERTGELLKNKDFMVIHRYLTELNSQFIALIFGSYAKNTQKSNSDIDILLISENPSKIEQELLLIPKNIHLTAVTPKEFILMAKSREFSVVQEAIKSNIIFIGIEDYYLVLKNAGFIKNKRIREEHTSISNRTINRKSK